MKFLSQFIVLVLVNKNNADTLVSCTNLSQQNLNLLSYTILVLLWTIHKIHYTKSDPISS